MRLRRVIAVVGGVGVLCLALWQALRAESPPIGPRTNFDRLHPGMTLAEVEAILGPAGPSLSSIRSLDVPHEAYYIWRGGDGWSRVWAVGGKVTRLEFDPSLSGDG